MLIERRIQKVQQYQPEGGSGGGDGGGDGEAQRATLWLARRSRADLLACLIPMREVKKERMNDE